jgi:hypothetical protein
MGGSIEFCLLFVVALDSFPCTLVCLCSCCSALAVASLLSRGSVMARSKSLEEAEREMAAATLVETEIAVEGTPTKGHGEMPFCV